MSQFKYTVMSQSKSTVYRTVWFRMFGWWIHYVSRCPFTLKMGFIFFTHHYEYTYFSSRRSYICGERTALLVNYIEHIGRNSLWSFSLKSNFLLVADEKLTELSKIFEIQKNIWHKRVTSYTTVNSWEFPANSKLERR